jgi:HK97 family phage prohead protease
MNKIKKLSFRNLELRGEDKDGKKYIEGIIPYNSKSVPMWGVTEVIDRSAFNKTLKENKEIRAFWNHDDSKVLGNTKSGTLELDNSGDGLICRCELPDTSYANDLYEIITRGDVKTMSFGFRPIKWQDSENGKLRTLKEVQLEEVSYGVSFPAYPETNSNTYLRGFMKREIDIESINEILKKEELTEDDLTALQEAADTLNKLIKENTKEPEQKPEEEAADKEPPKEDTRKEDSTSEKVKKELLGLIDTLFEIEKEKENEQ